MLKQASALLVGEIDAALVAFFVFFSWLALVAFFRNFQLAQREEQYESTVADLNVRLRNVSQTFVDSAGAKEMPGKVK